MTKQEARDYLESLTIGEKAKKAIRVLADEAPAKTYPPAGELVLVRDDGDPEGKWFPRISDGNGKVMICTTDEHPDTWEHMKLYVPWDCAPTWAVCMVLYKDGERMYLSRILTEEDREMLSIAYVEMRP